MDKSSSPSWERYERLVAELVRNQLPTEYCVTPNARVKGLLSGRVRQIDVLIDSRHAACEGFRLIVDAKARGRRIDVTHVEAFRGLMEDVGATHGYLVCPHGFSEAAERRAQDAVSIRLLPLDRLENFDPSTWPQCLASARCKGRIFWDGYPAVEMTLAPANGKSEYLRTSYVHYVGKCDRCSKFHVKCTSCGDCFGLEHDADEYDIGKKCKCDMPWLWLASIEDDGAGGKSAELHFVRGVDFVDTVSRRSL
ncbi:restriction endonuclease [Chitinimonas sp. JJ19]|uniref:restriction endonuclease n=1 Tax=Chitinimonas sp. JJ19 TaxID=3109352 RepID=UPI003FA5FBD9